jgi:hypothetical protein
LRGRPADRGGKADHNKAGTSAQDTTPAVLVPTLLKVYEIA